MGKAQEILNRYRGQQRIANGTFYDPDGDDVGLANVTCSGCLFSWGDKCAPFKELGYSEVDMQRKQIEVNSTSYCDYILSDFDGDDRAKKEIRALNERLFGSAPRNGVSASSLLKNSKGGWLWITIGVVVLFLVFKK